MAHFAELDDDNTVLRVIVLNDSDTADAEGVEDEAIGIAWIGARLPGRWLQTSYNTKSGAHQYGGTPLRGRYAGIGMVYVPDSDVFVDPKPYPSWVLNLTTVYWEAPVTPELQSSTDPPYYWNEDTGAWVVWPPPPDDGKVYEWDDDSKTWVEE